MPALFVQKPAGVGATMTAANAALDGSGSSGTTIWPLILYTGGPNSNGGWLDYIIFKILATVTTDTVCRIFLSDNNTLGAPHCSLIGEVLISHSDPQPSATTTTNDYIWTPPDGFGEIPQGATIFVTESQASTIRAFAGGGLY